MSYKSYINIYFFFIFYVIISFVVYLIVMFGKKIENLAEFGNSLTFCFEVVFGHIKPVKELFKYDFDAAMIFLLPFTITITFVMVYLFTAIIVNAFDEKAAELKRFYKIRAKTEIPKIWFIYRFYSWLKFK